MQEAHRSQARGLISPGRGDAGSQLPPSPGSMCSAPPPAAASKSFKAAAEQITGSAASRPAPAVGGPGLLPPLRGPARAAGAPAGPGGAGGSCVHRGTAQRWRAPGMGKLLQLYANPALASRKRCHSQAPARRGMGAEARSMPSHLGPCLRSPPRLLPERGGPGQLPAARAPLAPGSVNGIQGTSHKAVPPLLDQTCGQVTRSDRMNWLISSDMSHVAGA